MLFIPLLVLKKRLKNFPQLINKELKTYSDNLKKGVGAKTLRFEKIKNVKGSLEFKGSDIKIYFEKLTKRQKN